MAIILSTLAGATLVAGWWSQARDGLSTGLLPLIFFLVVAISAAYRFPIHISRQLKVEMTTIPTYLIAVLLPTAPLAATAAGVGILTGEVIMRARRGNYWSDVVTAASRCTLVVFVSAGLGHLVTRDITIHLVAVAVSLWAGDLLTVPLVLGPMSGEPPHRIISTVARETFLSESVQYMLGMVGALAALAQTWALLLLVVPTGLVYLAFTSVTEVQAGTRQMLERMADMVDLRDPTTGGHSRRVAELARHILRELDVQGPEADLIIAAARIHDIGKIGIPDQVLNKAGPLTPAERAIMETHAERGAELLLRYPDFARGVAVVRHHHEAWDGSGYPDRLRGLDIPFGARVVAVADSYDAMTTKRPYRQAMPGEKAALILRQGRAQQWDPAVVDACLRVIAGRLAPVEHPHVAEATRGESIEQPA